MTETDLAYLAGFFDGEGCVGVYPNSHRTGHYLLVQLTQNDDAVARALLESVRDRWGGSIREQRTSTGRVKLGYGVTSDKAAVLLRDLLPYLRGKREQAEVAATWQEGRVAGPRGPSGRLVPRSDEARQRDAAVAAHVKALKGV